MHLFCWTLSPCLINGVCELAIWPSTVPIFDLNCRACVAYKGLADSAARAASDEYYSTVFRLSLNDRINPHAFSFTIAKMIQQRSDPRMKSLNFSLRSLMHEGEGPFFKALNNARRALEVNLSSTLIVRLHICI